MAKMNKILAVLAAAGLLTSGAAQAALIDRGGGMIYDSDLNITWLQDANYAQTSGYDADGRMNWTAANAWAGNLVYGGYDDWRLASNTPVGANWNYNFAFNGTTDVGYNIISPHSELSYMYYVNLGLDGYYSPSGTYQPTWGIFENGTLNGTDNSSLGQRDIGLIDNLQSYVYWSGTAYAPNPAFDALFFYAGYGVQNVGGQVNEFYAWAVRPGDVAAVPEPASGLLIGLALAGLAALRRRRPLDAS